MPAWAVRLAGMDDAMWRPEPPEPDLVRPETDLQESNSATWVTEDLARRPDEAGANQVFTDPVLGPVILP